MQGKTPMLDRAKDAADAALITSGISIPAWLPLFTLWGQAVVVVLGIAIGVLRLRYWATKTIELNGGDARE